MRAATGSLLGAAGIVTTSAAVVLAPFGFLTQGTKHVGSFQFSIPWHMLAGGAPGREVFVPGVWAAGVLLIALGAAVQRSPPDEGAVRRAMWAVAAPLVAAFVFLLLSFVLPLTA
jgi:hypothetical protein